MIVLRNKELEQREFGALDRLGTKMARNSIAKNVKEIRSTADAAERLANGKYRDNKKVSTYLSKKSEKEREKLPILVRNAQKKLPKIGTETYKRFVSENKIPLENFRGIVDNYRHAGTRYGVGM